MTVIHSFGRLGREYIISCSRYREGPGFITLFSGGAVMITTLSACVFLVDDGCPPRLVIAYGRWGGGLGIYQKLIIIIIDIIIIIIIIIALPIHIYSKPPLLAPHVFRERIANSWGEKDLSSYVSIWWQLTIYIFFLLYGYLYVSTYILNTWTSLIRIYIQLVSHAGHRIVKSIPHQKSHERSLTKSPIAICQVFCGWRYVCYIYSFIWRLIKSIYIQIT